MNWTLRPLFISFLFLLGFSISEIQNDQASKSEEPDFRLLFVGNSLTYTNNLPKLVKKSAKQKGITIETKMLALPNYAIVDHWQDGKVQKLIASEQYDFVIIQQGPSSQQDGSQMLLDGGKNYHELCKKHKAKLVYFMVWPSQYYYRTFDGVIQNYSNAAKVNKAMLCPVGKVWKKHFDKTNNFDYYGPDGFHPSKKGSQVAADVIVNTLFP